MAGPEVLEKLGIVKGDLDDLTRHVTDLYTVVAPSGVNELGWTGANALNPPGGATTENFDDAFPGGPNGGPPPLPGHPNTPNEVNVVADFDESGTNLGGTIPDQWHYWAYLWVKEGESVDLRENDPAAEQGVIWVGECCGPATERGRWAYQAPYRGGQFATSLGPGFHFIGIAVHDNFAQSGVDVEWSPTGANSWSNIPADRLFTECPIVECRPVLWCADGEILEIDNATPVTLGPNDQLHCSPATCTPSPVGADTGGTVNLTVEKCDDLCLVSPQRGFRGGAVFTGQTTLADLLPTDRTEQTWTAPCDAEVVIDFRSPDLYVISRRTRIYAYLDVELLVNGAVVETEPAASYMFEDERQDTNPDVIPPIQYQFRQFGEVKFRRTVNQGDTVNVRWNIRRRTVGDQPSSYARLLAYHSHVAVQATPVSVVTEVTA